MILIKDYYFIVRKSHTCLFWRHLSSHEDIIEIRRLWEVDGTLNINIGKYIDLQIRGVLYFCSVEYRVVLPGYKSCVVPDPEVQYEGSIGSPATK